jgi:hypothetical protein
MSPRRIQLRRTKGWRLPAGAIVVTRSTRWGNPFPVTETRNAAVAAFRAWLLDLEPGQPDVKQVGRRIFDRRWMRANLATLRGHDLACWCPPGEPDICHAAVLLELANRESTVERPNQPTE